MSAKPTSSSAFIIVESGASSKDILFCSNHGFMDKYHTVVLIFMIGGIGIGAYNTNWVMFWVMIAGTIAIILYSSYTASRERRAERRRKRRS